MTAVMESAGMTGQAEDSERTGPEGVLPRLASA